MGFRFRKSFKVAPGVRVNVGKKSASVSIGGKGMRVTKSTTGRTTKTVGIPGTGLSYTSTSTSKKKRHSKAADYPSTVNLHEDIIPANRAAQAEPFQIPEIMPYEKQMKAIKPLAILVCIMSMLIIIISPLFGAGLYLLGTYLSTLPKTYTAKTAGMAATPIYKRKAVIAALIIMLAWLFLCCSI